MSVPVFRWILGLALGLLPASGLPHAAGRQAPRLPEKKVQAVPARAVSQKDLWKGRVPVTVPALLARSRPAQGAPLLQPAILLEHLTSHARHQLRPDGRGGTFSPRQMRALMDFLRCHHTGKRRPMDQRLVSLIYRTARRFNNAKVYIIAGYRAPKVAAQKGNPNSPHKRGVAADFRLEGVPIEVLRDYLRRTYPNIGVGYYPNSGFVHLDVGRKASAFWIDYSSPGQRAQYAAAPEEGIAPPESALTRPVADPPARLLLNQDAPERGPSPHDS